MLEGIDENGNIIQHLITDSQGKASATVNTGNYTIRETKTKEEYKICEDKNVTINWNEELELKIENEKKKGQIKVIKQDKDDPNTKIEGVEFEIQDDEGKIVGLLKTNEFGEAVSSKLPIGNYYIRETKTLENYMLNTEEPLVCITYSKVISSL